MSEPPSRKRATRLRAVREAAPAAPESPLSTMAPASLEEAARLAEDVLEAAGVEECVADARLLLAHALGATPTWIFVHGSEAVPPEGWRRFGDLVRRRMAHEPVQHLMGVQEFCSLRIAVTPDVLIPRPETELLVELLEKRLHGAIRPRIADVGTGSGCVALALAVGVPGSRIVASDVSAAALAVARSNARALGLDDRITFVEGPLLEPLRVHAPFDALAANLPYVGEGEWERLEPEVRDHEPRGALVGGPEGTELMFALLSAAAEVLAPGAPIALEIGWQQGAAVANRMKEEGFGDVVVHRDLAGHERVVEGRRLA